VYILQQSTLANAVLSGITNVSFECGNADTSNGTNVLGRFSCAALVVDGQQFPGADVITSYGSFPMDTAYLQNGTHSLQVEVTWRNPDNSNSKLLYLTEQSQPVTITVSNQISYPQWEPEIGELDISAYFVTTTCADADWHIDIFYMNTNYVQRLSGHTMDGTIEAYWNMTDTNGVIRTNIAVDPYFDAKVTISDPVTGSLPRKFPRTKTWPDWGVWTICYQDFFKFEYSENNDMKGSIDAFATTAAKYGGYYLWFPTPEQTNIVGQTYPLRYQKTNHFDATITDNAILQDAALLVVMLTNSTSRNFYYNGHGNKDCIDDEVLSTSFLKKYIKHRYRFVFLDACNTASGHLDSAFGIHGPGQYAITYYQNTGIRPGAFVGYTVEPDYNDGDRVTVNGVEYDDTIPWQVPQCIYNFMFYWDAYLMGWQLNDALAQAAADLPIAFQIGNQPGRNLAIYGYDDMLIDECNHKTDW
jgi:hypothetical protein